RRGLVELAQEFPWVLVDPQLRLERGPAECFHGREADGVHPRRDRDDLLRAQVAAKQRLLGVPKSGVDEPDARLLPGHYAVASAARFSPWRCSTSLSCSPMIRAASQAAFFAPASPMATVATGTPAGIWTIEYSESRPPRCCVGTGTPITGRSVHAATTPGRCAAPPAAAMTTFKPRDRAPVAHSMTPRGFRCAEQILSSCVNPRSSSTLTQASINGRSDFEPRMTPTTGCITRPPERYLSGRKPLRIVPSGPRPGRSPWLAPQSHPTPLRSRPARRQSRVRDRVRTGFQGGR